MSSMLIDYMVYPGNSAENTTFVVVGWLPSTFRFPCIRRHSLIGRPAETIGSVRVVSLGQSSVENHSPIGVEFREAARLTPSHERIAVVQRLGATLREHRKMIGMIEGADQRRSL